MASPSSSTSSSTSYNAATGAETVTVTTTVYDAALGASVGTGQVYSGQQAPQAPVLNPPWPPPQLLTRSRSRRKTRGSRPCNSASLNRSGVFAAAGAYLCGFCPASWSWWS